MFDDSPLANHFWDTIVDMDFGYWCMQVVTTLADERDIEKHTAEALVNEFIAAGGSPLFRNAYEANLPPEHGVLLLSSQ